MIEISSNVSIAESELEFSAIRAQGAGGQNVNKVSSAIHLRFNIAGSSLPEFYKQRLLSGQDSRITRDGILVLKAQSYRTQDMNRQDAVERLVQIIRQAGVVQKARRPTKPTKASQKRRVEGKKKLGQRKTLRKKVDF